MNAYPAYKVTEYKWLGDIPAHWNWLFLSQACYSQEIRNIGNAESNVLSLSYGRIIRKKDINFGLVPKDYQGYQIVDSGNIILRLTDLQNDRVSLRTGLVREKGIITSAYTCLAPFQNAEYLQLLLHAYDVQKYFYGLGGGVRQSISFKDIKYTMIPLPPLEEQDRIARWLDWQTSRIAHYSRVKKREIECLRELRKAIISEAVTSGIDDDVPMKPTEIPWLSKIPDHWKIERAKALFIKENRPIHDDDDVVTCFRDGEVTLRKNRRITGFTESLKEYGYQGVRLGDLVIHVMDAFAGSVGVSDSDGKCTPVYSVCTPRKPSETNSYFYAHLLREMARTNYIQSLYRGIRERSSNFGFDIFGMQGLPQPPRDEQDRIVAYLDEQCAVIDAALAKLSREIELMDEYKASIISDAVTGKIDLQGAEIPDFEPIHDANDEEGTGNEDD